MDNYKMNNIKYLLILIYYRKKKKYEQKTFTREKLFL